jgi:hypothetical protein
MADRVTTGAATRRFIDVADGGVVPHRGAHVGVAEEDLRLAGVEATLGELGRDGWTAGS